MKVNEFWNKKRVIVTGHTGFKGSWLAIWLNGLGADVLGVALPPVNENCNYSAACLGEKIASQFLDIRNGQGLTDLFREFQPDIVFHLAAQALVSVSYKDVRTTFESNVLGTLNVLEAIRETPSVKAGVMITSDKCYQNVEQIWAYREFDRLCGDDPYSASKAAAEMVINCYQKSFLNKKGGPFIASARAGNVIGGGDWSQDRLVPDCFRSLYKGETIIIRNPQSTRPWQFVLEPLRGYILLGAKLFKGALNDPLNFNFGPSLEKAYSVEKVVNALIDKWGSGKMMVERNSAFHECNLLQLDCTKARVMLNWNPILSFEDTISFTSDWYKNYFHNTGKDMYGFCRKQIEDYCFLAADQKQALE